MKKLIAILLVITCLFTLGACAKKQKPLATPTPAVNTQEGDFAEGDVTGTGNENTQQGGKENTPAVSVDAVNSETPTTTSTPPVTAEPGVDLNDDVLTDDVVTQTATPALTQTPSLGNQDVTPTVEPTIIATFPPLFDDDTVISLPMDIF